MLAASGTEPIGEAGEVDLISCVQHLDDGALDDLVPQCGDTERPLSTVRLRNVDATRWFRAIRSSMQTRMEFDKASLESLPVRNKRDLKPADLRDGFCTVGFSTGVGGDLCQDDARREGPREPSSTSSIEDVGTQCGAECFSCAARGCRGADDDATIEREERWSEHPTNVCR